MNNCTTNFNRFAINNNDIYINNALFPLLSPEIYIPDIFRQMNPCENVVIPTTYFTYSKNTWNNPPLNGYNNNFVYTLNTNNPDVIKAILFSNTNIPLLPQYQTSAKVLYDFYPFLAFLPNDGFTRLDMNYLQQYFYYNGMGILLALIIFMMNCQQNFQNFENNTILCNIPLLWKSTSTIVVYPDYIERLYYGPIEGGITYILYRNVMLHLKPPNNPLGSLFNMVIDVVRDIILLLRSINENGPNYLTDYFINNIPINQDINYGACLLKPYMFIDTKPYIEQYIENDNEVDII
jgi:hypothetical protein